MANLYTIHRQPMACLPIFSFIFQTLRLIRKMFGGTDNQAATESGKVYKTTTIHETAHSRSKSTHYENGNGSVIYILGFIAIGYVAYYAYSIVELALNLLTDTWLMFFIPLFFAGFLSQFARSRLELALTTWKVSSTSRTSLPIMAAKVCAGLVVFYPSVVNGEPLDVGWYKLWTEMGLEVTGQWYEYLIGLVTIPFSSYYLFFRPLACSITMTSAYYFFSPRNWRALLDPMNVFIALTLYFCYLIHTGQPDSLVTPSEAHGLSKFSSDRLIGIGIFWSVVIAAQVSVCYGMWRVVGDSELPRNKRMASLMLTLVSGGVLFAILLKVFPAARMGRLTDTVMSIESLVWLKPFAFWGYVVVSIAVFLFFIKRSWKNSFWALISHVYIMLWIVAIFDIPKYSALLDTYGNGIVSILGLS